MKRFALAIALLGLVALPQKVAALTYDLVPFSVTIDTQNPLGSQLNGVWDVTGSVRTDGTLGVLAITNFTRARATAVRQSDNVEVTLDVDNPSFEGLTISDGVIIASEEALDIQFFEGGELRFSGLAFDLFDFSVGFRRGSVIGFVESTSLGIITSTVVSNENNLTLNNATAVVPVPPALPLALAGLGVMAWVGRRKQAEA